MIMYEREIKKLIKCIATLFFSLITHYIPKKQNNKGKMKTMQLNAYVGKSNREVNSASQLFLWLININNSAS